ncbi:MAG TPA: 6-bladed beta-propeller [Cyclobacteriaceae bacterium]|nr:6-bladed beta-propeller [Cyclobacteriaceae bacterium]
MISRTLICISFLILMSCTDHQRVRQTAGIIDIGLMDVQEEEPRYAVQTIIPLETTTDNLLGVNLIIKSLGENVFVLDEDRKDAIYRFDQTGDFLGKVVQVGEGPGMLNNITDFVADRDSLHVLVGRGDHSDIVKISLSDGNRKHLSLEGLGFSLSTSSDGDYLLYASYNLPLSNHRIIRFDPSGELVSRNLKNDYHNQMLPMEEINFSKEGDQLFFKEAFNPVIYRIEEDTIVPTYRFDHGSYAIPAKFWEVDIMQGFEMINQSGFADVYRHWESDRYAFFEVYIQSQEGVQNHQVLLDKKENSLSKKIMSRKDNNIFYRSAGFTAEDELMFVTPANYLLQYAEQHTLDEQVRQIIETIEKEDNPVLLICKLK